jgi:hypothetical protein
MADLEQLVLSISADTRQMQRALQRLVGDTQAAADNVDKAFGTAPPKIDNVSKSLGKTRAETANLAAQFQDIAVQLQGGQSPFTVALQQGSQIGAVIGQQGAAGAVGLLSSAFVSLLSPVNLAIIAVIALGGAAVQYAAKAIGAVGDLDDTLKAHGELIKSLRDSYGELGKGVETSVNESTRVLRALLSLSTADLQKQLQQLSRGALATAQSVPQAFDFSGVLLEQTDKFGTFRAAIDAFNKSVAAGSPNLRGFREAVAGIIDSSADESVRKLGKSLLDATEQANRIQLALDGTNKALRGLSAEAQAAAAQGEAFAKAMKELGGTVSPDLTDRQRVMQNYAKALENAGGTEERLAAARRRDDQLGIISANERKKATEDASKSADSAAKRFDSALNSTARQTASMTGAAQAIGLGAGALARFETQARLTETAQQTFGKVTEETAAKIRAQAEAAGVAADALARAKTSSQIDFAGKTAFLSDEDVRIAQQLSGIYGNDVPAALSSSYAAAITLNDALRNVAGSLSSELTSGLTDIVSGSKSASQGFNDMAASIIRDIERMIIKLLVVGPLMKALQSGFNSLGIGDLLGGSSSSLPLPGQGSFIGPVTLADGGLVRGAGGPRSDSILARVSAGEYVVNARATSRHRSLLDAINGYADGGPVLPSLPSIARGGSAPTTNVIIQGAPSQPSVSERPNGTGGRDINITFRDMVRGVVGGDLASGQGLARNFKQFPGAGAFRGS